MNDSAVATSDTMDALADCPAAECEAEDAVSDDIRLVSLEMSEVLSGLSHALGNSLWTVDSYTQMAVEEAGDRIDGRVTSHLSAVLRASQRMVGVLNGMKLLASVCGKELHPRAVDLSALATTIAEEYRRAGERRQVQFQIAPGLTADGDPELLEMVMRHLFENAWKFTARQIEATIAFGRTPARGAADATQTFFVRDNGAGFDEAFAEGLFSPFRRLHPRGEFEGQGLGLAIVRRIIHQHGGRVRAKGSVGAGACFFFSLPTDGWRQRHE